MPSTVQVRGTVKSVWSALAKLFLTQESFFSTEVFNRSPTEEARVMLAAAEPGALLLHWLTPEEPDLIMIAGAYVASDPEVTVSSQYHDNLFQAFLSKSGFFVLRASGKGKVACSAKGSIHKLTLQKGEVHAIDNGHLVAWSANMQYKTRMANGRSVTASITSGEGPYVFLPRPRYDLSSEPQAQRHSVHGKERSRSAVMALQSGSHFGRFCNHWTLHLRHVRFVQALLFGILINRRHIYM